MPLAFDIDAAQSTLNELNLSGWLLYDFHGQNPIAAQALGLEDAHITRRLFYYIPLSGEPTLFVSRIEASHVPALPGRRVAYARRGELQRGLADVLEDAFAVAMEYYPLGAIPYLSRVDAGTVEWVRQIGVDVAPSHPLVTRLLCTWDEPRRAAHERAVGVLVEAWDDAVTWLEGEMQAQRPPTEWDVQQRIVAHMERAGLVTDHAPVVALGAHAGDPHYAPREGASATLAPNHVLLIDLWARDAMAGSPYGDLTFMTWIGPDAVPDQVQRAFEAVLAARDAAFDLARARWEAEEPIVGWELDRASRRCVHEAGFGDDFTHRTGHNLGYRSAHGDGPHLDDLETHDDRAMVPRVGFTIEPGVYRPQDGFGIRSEIDVYIDPEAGPVSYSEPQRTWRVVDPTPRPASDAAPESDADA